MALTKENEKVRLNDDIKGLIALPNTNFSNIDEALTNCIEYCIRKTDFEFASVCKVEGSNIELLHTTNLSISLTNERILALNKILYKRISTTKTTLISRNVVDTIFYDLPSYITFDIETIICVPIVIKEKICGSLTFCSTKINKKTAPSTYSINIIEFLAQVVSKILKEQHDKDELKAKSDHLEQFNNDLEAFTKIGSTHFSNFSENLMAYINFGKKITGFENAFIGEVNKEVYKIIEGSITTCKSKPGDIFKLCDTLCREAIEKKTTVAYPKLKNSKYYNVLGRVAFKSESSIIVPLKVDNEIIGVVRFCSTKEYKPNFKFKYYISIVELIAERISKLIKNERTAKELNKKKLLLKMGAEVFEMASYSRSLSNDIVYVTPEFSQIFDLEFDEKKDTLHIKELISIIDGKVIDEDKQWYYKNVQEIKTKNIEPFEYRIRTRCGKIKWLRHHLQFDELHKDVLGVIQNITPVKQVQERLQTKNTELEQYAYATAHDLQEPLRTIEGYSNILIEACKNKLNRTEKEYFSYIVKASNRMKEQIDGLLNHSKIGGKKQMELVNMNNLLSNVLSDLKCNITKTKAVIIVRDLPDVFGYATELRLMLLNLIGNTLKFKQPGKSPTIEIGYNEAKEHYWTFYIKDDGIGISKQNIKKIFNLFARLNKRSEFEGTGIGLTHCKKIANLHGGEIYVHSELDKGSIFNFTIKK